MYNTKQIKQLESLAIEKAGISEWMLMQRAGLQAFELLQVQYPEARAIAIFCGNGNNAGDGYVLAKKAKEAGKIVICFYLSDPNQLKQPALMTYEEAKKSGVMIDSFNEQIDLSHYDVLVDALLGTGFKGQLHSDFLQAIKLINATNIPVIALDIPSGLNADTGVVSDVAVFAAKTVTFIGVKQGLFTADAKDYCGEIFLADLELSEELFADMVPSAENLNLDVIKRTYLLRRWNNTHKGHYGHVAVIGGDTGMSGAVRMAAEMAARAGAGLTSVFTQPEHVSVITTARPEIMAHPLENPKKLVTLLEGATVLALGPGLGRNAWGQECFNTVMAIDKPKIIDADALWFLAKHPQSCGNAILTPHPKEAAMLLNTTTEIVQQDRFAAIRQLQQQYGCIIILKGAGTLIFNGEEPVYVCSFGNPGMASGGMGDVLTGLIAGLVAQDIPLMGAACLAVSLHAAAGDRCVQKEGVRGMLAMDLLPYVRYLMNH